MLEIGNIVHSTLNSSAVSETVGSAFVLACGTWYASWVLEMVGSGDRVCAAATEATGKCWGWTCEAACLAVSSTALHCSVCCPGCADTSLGVGGVRLGQTGVACLDSCSPKFHQLATSFWRSLIIPAWRLGFCW